ncbi:Regulator of chromosome condensation 1/beta-lactamase-inhibitor protein II [Pseudocohnilembus persalinus]|uniref:Regulator of chromosome condensation 1/beta-lactamase-inhibitor protein II n=1 Tax=Pseudocohnilembus persalinus TaxID=266149 RepID=A0A0V0R115_PSEPJ|nr:Regulator of chromosome condensation 1/beta-lactamase-inhibitor protein II [Pseudocohnilembus persalinus]|eukprot:KRX08045.1 Regulator of chromosome condensation 1/beta-lactamase-inhibitor protein II [Pseudocohnilembus persalinus]
MKTFARGLNFMGQLGIGNKNQNLQKFTEIEQLSGKNVSQLEAHFTQSYCRLDDGQILHWGYVLDSLTTTRVLNYYKKSPKISKLWQKYSFFGKTLGLRLGEWQMGLLNKEQIMKHQPNNISIGGSFIMYTTDKGVAYGMGENYKGQLGLGNNKFQFTFEPIQVPNNEKIKQVSAGFQHSVLVTVDFYNNPMRMIIKNEKIKKVSSGFHHSIYLCESGNLYGLGFNSKGQCGTSNLNRLDCEDFQKIFTNLEDDEYITDIASGKSHNVFITNKGGIYMFGAVKNYQLAREQSFYIDICSPTEVHLKLEDGEIPIKVKANFDRSAVLTNFGNAYVWGGESQEKICLENHYCIENIKKSMAADLGISQDKIIVKDVGLGYLHTLVSLQLKQ